MPQHLFVYGTLRSEFPHPLALRLKSQAKLVGKGSAPGVLYDFGWYPGAVFDADARTRVIGDVFALKNAERLLAQLDHYEGTAEPGKPKFGPKDVLDFRRIHLKRGVQTVTVTVAKKPAWAGIDPYNKEIDRISDDNAIAVVAAR